MSRPPEPIPIEKDPDLNKDILQLLVTIKNQKLPPFDDKLSVKDARDIYGQLNQPYPNPKGVEIRKNVIINQDNLTITLHIVRPENRQGNLPAFMFFQGGAFCIFDFSNHQNGVVDLVNLSGAVCVYVQYTRAPEAPYPTQINEAFAATKWVAEKGHEIGVDGSRLALVGISSGGCLATVTAIKCKENNNTPKIRVLVLLTPWLDITLAPKPALIKYGEDRFVSKGQLTWSAQHYVRNSVTKPAATDYYYNPFVAKKENLKGLPPVFMQIGDSDPLRDSMEEFGQRLEEAGVSASCVTYNGSIHAFNFINGIEEVSIVKSGDIHAAAELKRYLLTYF